MFRKMRRIHQALTTEKIKEVIKRNNTCTLAMIGDGGYPYSLPITYVYSAGKFYLHGAKSGHKTDAIKSCAKISLSIIDHDEVIEEKYTNKYRSIVVFGTAKIIEDENEICTACRILAQKVCPNALDGIEAEIADGIKQTAIIEITPEHITGKEGLEFFNTMPKQP